MVCYQSLISIWSTGSSWLPYAGRLRPEKFSTECQKSKTKVIAGPIRTRFILSSASEKAKWKQVNYLKRGKTGVIKSRWFLACTLLVEKMVRVFWTDHKAKLSESKAIPHYFRLSIESCSLWGDYMLTMFVHKVLSGWFPSYRSFGPSVIVPIACKLFESILTIRAIVRKPHGLICGKFCGTVFF